MDQAEVANVREELLELVERGVGGGEELIGLIDTVSGGEGNSSSLDHVNVNAHASVREELVNLVVRGKEMIGTVDHGNGEEDGSNAVDYRGEGQQYGGSWQWWKMGQ